MRWKGTCPFMVAAAIAMAAGACGASPSRTREPAPPSPPAAAAVPVPVPVPVGDQAEGIAPHTDADPRDVAFVSVLAQYRSAGREVYEEPHDHDHDRELIACFDAAFPRDTRNAEVYYFRIYVPNPAHDENQITVGRIDDGGGMSYPPPGTYPDLEACMRAAVVEYRAPPDVELVAIRIHVHTNASRGTLGHGH